MSASRSCASVLISCFRDDANLKCLYHGPKARKRGLSQKFAGKVDLKNLDMDIFNEEFSVDGKLVYKRKPPIKDDLFF